MIRLKKISKYTGLDKKNFFCIEYKDKTLGFCIPYFGHKNRLTYTRIYNKPRMKATKTNYVNPIYGWWHKIYWGSVRNFYRAKGEGFKICQGCGAGISKYKIRDPNHGHGNEWFNCCAGCVHFYDIRCSALEIKEWVDERSIGGSLWKK